MSIKQNLLIASCLCLLSAFPAFAEEVMLTEEIPSELKAEPGLSGDMTLTSNYIYRGITQTAGKPTIQGGIDYVHSSHFYIGAWASGVSIFRNLYTEKGGLEGAANSRYELDTYFGYRNNLGKGWGYDVGFLRYNFPGSYPATKADTNELYGAVHYRWLQAKYSYSLGSTFANPQTRGTDYLELNAVYHIEPAGMALSAHYGKQNFKGTGAITAAGDSLSYSDYRLSATKEIAEKYELSLAYSSTNATAAYTSLGRQLGKSAFVASVTRLF